MYFESKTTVDALNKMLCEEVNRQLREVVEKLALQLTQENQHEIADAATIGDVDGIDSPLRRNPSELPAGLYSALVGLILGQLHKPLADEPMHDIAGLISHVAVAISERKGHLPKLSKLHKKASLPEPMRAVATRTFLHLCFAPLTVHCGER